MNNKIQWKSLLVSLAVSLGTGALSAFVTREGMRGYAGMYKPPLSPPAWVFSVVWTLLFVLMGIAAYRIWVSGQEDGRQALTLYGIQLLVNALWSVLFFNLEAYLLAFAWLLLLWYLILLTILRFLPIDKVAAKLLIPYLVWVTFAGYLNLAIALHEMW